MRPLADLAASLVRHWGTIARNAEARRHARGLAKALRLDLCCGGRCVEVHDPEGQVPALVEAMNRHHGYTTPRPTATPGHTPAESWRRVAAG